MADLQKWSSSKEHPGKWNQNSILILIQILIFIQNLAITLHRTQLPVISALQKTVQSEILNISAKINKNQPKILEGLTFNVGSYFNQIITMVIRFGRLCKQQKDQCRGVPKIFFSLGFKRKLYLKFCF